MQARSIERHVAMLGRTGILAAAMLAASCAPQDFPVRGTATGVLVPVTLELRLGDDIELLSVTQDGTFAFETRLEDGSSYTVLLVDPSTPCALSEQTGVIAGSDTAIELACTGASLANVVVSGIAPTVPLVLGATEYKIDLPLSQSSVTLTATVALPGDTLTIAGTPVSSGTPSAPFTLNLGDNPVDIVVQNTLGWQRTYRLTLRRAKTHWSSRARTKGRRKRLASM